MLCQGKVHLPEGSSVVYVAAGLRHALALTCKKDFFFYSVFMLSSYTTDIPFFSVQLFSVPFISVQVSCVQFSNTLSIGIHTYIIHMTQLFACSYST